MTTFDPQWRDVPPAINAQQRDWNQTSINWWAVHYVLGVLGIVATMLGALKEGASPSSWEANIGRFAPLVGTAIVAYITFFQASEWGTRFRKAWTILNNACNKYSSDHTAPTMILADAVQQGQEIIAGK